MTEHKSALFVKMLKKAYTSRIKSDIAGLGPISNITLISRVRFTTKYIDSKMWAHFFSTTKQVLGWVGKAS